MIISRGRRYIFVHIPKTGGTSMALALEARAMKDDILIGDTPKAKRRRGRLADLNAKGRLWKHSTLSDIEGIVDPSELAEMFTFALVRNPWDRMVSYYHWLKAQSFAHPAVALAKAQDFAGFVMHPQTAASITASPYDSYMRLSDGSEHADAYLRLEHLEQDLTALSDHLGFVLDIPHVNSSLRDADYRKSYDAVTAQQVALICAKDIKRFGYRFDG